MHLDAHVLVTALAPRYRSRMCVSERTAECRGDCSEVAHCSPLLPLPGFGAVARYDDALAVHWADHAPIVFLVDDREVVGVVAALAGAGSTILDEAGAGDEHVDWHPVRRPTPPFKVASHLLAQPYVNAYVELKAFEHLPLPDHVVRGAGPHEVLHLVPPQRLVLTVEWVEARVFLVRLHYVLLSGEQAVERIGIAGRGDRHALLLIPPGVDQSDDYRIIGVGIRRSHGAADRVLDARDGEVRTFDVGLQSIDGPAHRIEHVMFELRSQGVCKARRQAGDLVVAEPVALAPCAAGGLHRDLA